MHVSRVESLSFHMICDLTAGKYSIMPYTTGCRFKPRKSESSKEAKLVQQDKSGKYVITKAFR
jgi:hypothetical protein